VHLVGCFICTWNLSWAHNTPLPLSLTQTHILTLNTSTWCHAQIENRCTGRRRYPVEVPCYFHHRSTSSNAACYAQTSLLGPLRFLFTLYELRANQSLPYGLEVSSAWSFISTPDTGLCCQEDSLISDERDIVPGYRKEKNVQYKAYHILLPISHTSCFHEHCSGNRAIAV
jgi:hypothetical protein